MSRKEKNYKCDYCSKRFRIEGYFLKHVKIMHPSKNELTCSLCNKVFTFSIDLRKHKWNDHENSCDICGKAFLIVSELKSHIRKIHEESKHCTQCGKHMIVIPRRKRLRDFPTNVPFCKVPKVPTSNQNIESNKKLSKNNKS